MSLITELPDPPSRSDPDNFAARGDAFVAALPTMVTEINALFGAAVSGTGAFLRAISPTLTSPIINSIARIESTGGINARIVGRDNGGTDEAGLYFLKFDGVTNHGIIEGISGKLQIYGGSTKVLDVESSGLGVNVALRIVDSHTPANASASGAAGRVAWDADYVYVAVAANTWKRVAIATW